MNIEGFVLGYSLVGLAIMITMIIVRRRRAAASVIVLGLVMIVVEEPLLTLFWGFSDPEADRDGMANLVTDAAQTHVLDTAIFATALFVVFGWIALTAFRRGERWAANALLGGWILVTATMIVTSLAVSGRNFGWVPLAVAVLAWASGLWLRGPVRESVRSGQ